VTVRDATSADVDEMTDLFDRQRLAYEDYSPVFWRVAASARDAHRPFVELLVQSPGVVTLVSSEGGALIALDRGDKGWLIDDFAVPGDELWPTTGVELLCAALDRISRPVTVVAAHRHEAKRAALRAAGLQLDEEWWVRPPDAPTEDAADGDHTATLVAAPPVYDPGGPVLMTETVAADTQAVDGLLAHGARQGAAIVVVPVAAADATRRALLAERDFSIASEWYSMR
jgi:hypothetical protein